MWHFCCEKAEFFEYFGLNLDMDFTFQENFWTVFGLGLSLKKSGLDQKIRQSAHL